jgi:hypothetical protein
MPALRPVSLRIANVARQFSALCDGLFWLVAERLSLAAAIPAAPSRTQPYTRLNCLGVRSSHPPWNTALSSPLCGQVCDRPGLSAS